MSCYHTAQICLNGHLICESIEIHPEEAQSFCSDCGAQTIKECPSCHSKLRGYYDSDFIMLTKVEKYCFNCGNPYPWTSSALESTQLLIQEDEALQEQQKTLLIDSLPDVIVETPKTKLAVVRMQKLLNSAGKFTTDIVRQFVIDFGCELAKKSLNL